MKLLETIKNKELLWHIIFESDDSPSRRFDLAVMIAISLSLVCSFLESSMKVTDFSIDALMNFSLTPMGVLKLVLIVMEYVLTFFFAIEYCLRLWCSPNKKEYALSFFGIIDFLATFPTLLAIFIPAMRYMSMMRAFRLIRIFRVLKLFAFINEGYLLLQSIKLSLNKILVYFLFVVVLVTVIGTIMFMVEGDLPDTGFTSIPTSIYWAIVTLTTVGYGDITPATEVGRMLSSLVMILGYTIIAIPTGIVSATMIDETNKKASKGHCPRCGEKTDTHANYCKHCGEKL